MLENGASTAHAHHPHVDTISSGKKLTERPFTDSECNEGDRKTLAYLYSRLLSVVGAGFDFEDISVSLPEDGGRKHRIHVPQKSRLRGNIDCQLVGFFGHRKDEVSPELHASLHDLDQQLVREFANHPGILSYSSMELESGNFGNLVLLSQAGAGENWKASPLHAIAVHDYAPRFYSSIRLHNGVLEGGKIRFLRTKYYDFSAPSPWFGLREY